ncbi:hypothetical protein QQS21_000410 [Conoideocrella luteorostrata]|uniref:DUF7371 domain-containing protein n=1 Tax=Conoideocrella luteorostrata TaxID=1105319 RepID=A0AAJ0D107_9HYPO|nr:hypothetical protein QQS21_000410 [Conoideocrella luteorostrata]
MRTSFSIGAMVATSLLYHAAAQASYDNPDGGSDAGNPGGQDDTPQGTMTVTANGGYPNGVPSGQSCLMQETTTVFVTIYPTSPASNGNNSPSENPGSDGTAQSTVQPTRTVQVSPLGSSQDNQPTVEAFTTLTISDLWESGSSPGNNPTSASSDSAPITTGAPSEDSSSFGSGNYGTTTSASGEKPAETSGTGDTVTQVTGQNASPYNTGKDTPKPVTDGAGYTTVTDTVVEWITGSDGPSPITVVSAHTMTVPSVGTTDAPVATCWTVTGPDGKDTVVEVTLSTIRENSGTPVSVAVTTNTDGTFGPQQATSAVSEQTPVTTITATGPTPAYTGSGTTTTTSITVVGSDGVPTVVHSTWVIHSAPVTDDSGALPTGTSLSPAAGGNDVTSRTSYTVLGSDGKPTVVESTFVIPTSVVSATDLSNNLPNGATVQATPFPASQTVLTGADVPGAVTTCSSYTLLGTDGKLTIVESTYLIQGSTATPAATVIPSGVVTGVPSQTTVVPGQAVSGQMVPQPSTTCVSYTALGADGVPTVMESTIIVSNSNPLPTAASTGLSPMVPQGQTDSLPAGLQATPQADKPYTTCITVDILGPNGVATPVVETIVLTPPVSGQLGTTVPATIIGRPSVAPQALSDLPQGTVPSGLAANSITTSVTLTILGPNGPSTVVETIVITPRPQALTSGVENSLSVAEAASTGLSTSPGLQEYGPVSSPVQAISPPAVLSSASGVLPAGTDGATKSAVFTIVTGAGGIPVLSIVTDAPVSAYGDSAHSDDKGLPGTGSISQSSPGAYGWLPADASPVEYGALSLSSPQQAIPVTIQTSTWVNVIPEPTTTYTMKFALTTLATVIVPTRASVARRAIRRQDSLTIWSNSSSVVVQPLPESTSVGPSPPIEPTPMPPASSAIAPTTAMCPTGTKIGNTSLNFDTLKPGPIFNPSGDLWFSEGFLIAPLSQQAVQGYLPSSGGQLVEFVPPALTAPQAVSGCSDTAEIGVGPNSHNPCFRFNLYSANLGCAAQGTEKWCEFELSAYQYNQAAANEMSIAWSEVKRVPACPSFPNAPCPLTPVAFNGYQNITSVLIRLRVGSELRTWWADDLLFGWTDNTCAASQCRDTVAPQYVKREAVESALHNGVWHWTPTGPARLEDDYVWDSLN